MAITHEKNIPLTTSAALVAYRLIQANSSGLAAYCGVTAGDIPIAVSTRDWLTTVPATFDLLSPFSTVKVCVSGAITAGSPQALYPAASGKVSTTESAYGMVGYYIGTANVVDTEIIEMIVALRDGGRINLSDVNIVAAHTDGGLIKAGTASARVIEDTANMRFVNFNFDNGATSGDNRGIYNRLYLTGAGGGGESLRTFTSIEDVACGTAHGAHISLGFEASGSITGLGVASRNTLHIPNAVMPAGGTYAATQPEIYSDGATSAPAAVTELSFIRCINDGNATGIANVDDKAFLLSLIGGSVGAGNVMAAKTAAAVTHTLRMKAPNGTTYYIMVSDTQ